MGQDQGRIRIAGREGTSQAETPDQRGRHEENYRRHQEAMGAEAG